MVIITKGSYVVTNFAVYTRIQKNSHLIKKQSRADWVNGSWVTGHMGRQIRMDDGLWLVTSSAGTMHVTSWVATYLPLLSRVSTLTRDIDIAILSVRLSVTFRYQMKTA